MKVRQLSISDIVVIGLLVIHILPVWLFKYTATQDGPIHVHNAHVLREYHNHENYTLREVYKLNPYAFSELDLPRIYGGAHVYLSASHLRKDTL